MIWERCCASVLWCRITFHSSFGFHIILGLNFAGWEWAPCWPGLLDIVWWLVTLMGLTGFVVSSLVPLASPRCTVLSSAPARRAPTRQVYRLLLLLPKHSLLSCSEPAQEHRSRGEHGGACVPWFSDRPLWSLSKAGLLHLRKWSQSVTEQQAARIKLEKRERRSRAEGGYCTSYKTSPFKAAVSQLSCLSSVVRLIDWEMWRCVALRTRFIYASPYRSWSNYGR